MSVISGDYSRIEIHATEHFVKLAMRNKSEILPKKHPRVAQACPNINGPVIRYVRPNDCPPSIGQHDYGLFTHFSQLSEPDS
jgi:hypothetical protein